jgi:hypothetical protein
MMANEHKKLDPSHTISAMMSYDIEAAKLVTSKLTHIKELVNINKYIQILNEYVSFVIKVLKNCGNNTTIHMLVPTQDTALTQGIDVKSIICYSFVFECSRYTHAHSYDFALRVINLKIYERQYKYQFPHR